MPISDKTKDNKTCKDLIDYKNPKFAKKVDEVFNFSQSLRKDLLKTTK